MKRTTKNVTFILILLFVTLLATTINYLRIKSSSTDKIEFIDNHSEIKDTLFIDTNVNEDKVDLNNYLDSIDPETDWNYTEIGDYEQSILDKNNIYYDEQKGYWIKK